MPYAQEIYKYLVGSFDTSFLQFFIAYKRENTKLSFSASEPRYNLLIFDGKHFIYHPRRNKAITFLVFTQTFYPLVGFFSLLFLIPTSLPQH